MSTLASPHDKSLDQAKALFLACNYDAAEEEFRAFLAASPGDVQALTAYARLLIETKKYPQAYELLKPCLPHEDARLLATVSVALFKLGQIKAGQDYINQAAAKSPDDPLVQQSIGVCFTDAGQIEPAINHLKKSIDLDDQDALSWNYLSVALQKAHRTEEAEQASRKSIALRPCYEAAHANLLAALNRLNKLKEAREHLASTKALFPEGSLCEFMEAIILKREGKFEDAIKVLEARRYPQEPMLMLKAENELGLLYDRTGRHAAAFSHFKAFNELAVKVFHITEQAKASYLQEIEQCKKTFTPQWVSGWTSPEIPASGRTPAFIFGYPRSGTTLLQHALDSHPSIYASEEIPAFPKVVEKLQAHNYPECLARLNEDDIRQLQDFYFAVHRQDPQWKDRELLVDKYPQATVYLGLIRRIFPQARLILSLRHPCDAILSCYMSLFEPNRSTVHFYKLGDIVNHYCRTMDLMQHYEKVLGLKFYKIRYEDLTGDFEDQMRSLLEYLGMPWNEKVLAYDEKVRAQAGVRTASAEQVSEKIYSRAVNRWQHYKSHLTPYLDELAPHIEYLGYKAP